jgi:hypothetical protein
VTATREGVRKGGCLCGAVRYTVTWPMLATVVCHCKNCQRQSGSALSVVGVLARTSLAITGNLITFQDKGTSGQPVFRKFCSKCGSPVITDTPEAQEQGIIFIKAGTLDKADDLAPALHYWTGSAQSWFVFPDGVDCLETQ